MVTEKSHVSKKRSLLWASYTLLDRSLNKAALIDILKGLSSLGYETSLIALYSNTKAQSEKPPTRTILVPLRSFPFLQPVMYTGVLSVLLPLKILLYNPDFVILEPDVHVMSAFTGLLVSKIKKTKFILDIRSIPVETAGFRGFMQKFWFSISVSIAKKFFNGITIITPMMRDEICNQFNIDKSSVGVWTTGVSSSIFDAKNFKNTSELRKNLGLTGKFIVFYHGVFSPSRGLQETVETIKIIRTKYPDIVFFLLGAGTATGALKSLVHEYGLEDNVIIHNPVEHTAVPEFIAMSDVCIIPLPLNNFWRFQCPLKLLEYLSMEKVVIASDLPAHRIVMGDKKCGIYVSSVVPTELAKCIEYAYKNQDQLKEWGKSGLQIIKDRYDWEKVAQDLERYLLTL
jgi:glycosyltransferase involved in cell wall biosynthesis